VRYASATLHFGEEPVLVGRGGSGTVFLSRCNLCCVFCQNHQISQEGLGRDVQAEDLADVFLDMQAQGAENVNLVTPTHYFYPILLALNMACSRGLALPIVYNTNGYDSLTLLTLLDGIVDIYLPDLKYMDEGNALRYSAAPGYSTVAKAALQEMYRQVGSVELEHGAARKGLLIRHLVLPDDISGSYEALLWLKDAGLTEATIGLMSQYSPQYRAREYPELLRRLHPKEYRDFVEYAEKLGFEHVLTQSLASTEHYLPDFRRRDPFRSYA